MSKAATKATETKATETKAEKARLVRPQNDNEKNQEKAQPKRKQSATAKHGLSLNLAALSAAAQQNDIEKAIVAALNAMPKVIRWGAVQQARKAYSENPLYSVEMFTKALEQVEHERGSGGSVRGTGIYKVYIPKPDSSAQPQFNLRLSDEFVASGFVHVKLQWEPDGLTFTGRACDANGLVAPENDNQNEQAE